ncbi:MAG: N-acetyltransferase [Solobacterium sp.]|nr:N-acetyltransferase [Solobacterium sp.]
MFQKKDTCIWLEDEEGKRIAEIDFPEEKGGVVNINHTFVDDSLRGQGIASKLVEACVEELRKDGKKAMVTCSYAIRWFLKHEEAWDVLENVEEFKKQAETVVGAACGIQSQVNRK